jgi:hypothetical protein
MLAYCLLVDKAIICARQVGELSGINFLHRDVASTLQAASMLTPRRNRYAGERLAVDVLPGSRRLWVSPVLLAIVSFHFLAGASHKSGSSWIERFAFSLLPAILNALFCIATNDGFRPIRPHRINGRLAWKVEEIRRRLWSAH